MTFSDSPPAGSRLPPRGGFCPTGGAIKARHRVLSVDRSTHPPTWHLQAQLKPPASECSADPLHRERDQHADELERSQPWRRTSFARAAPAQSGGRSVRLLTVVRAG